MYRLRINNHQSFQAFNVERYAYDRYIGNGWVFEFYAVFDELAFDTLEQMDARANLLLERLNVG